MNLFNINFEFDKEQVQSSIMSCVNKKEKGYVCAVDTNIVSIANRNEYYLSVINNSLLNICDGGTIATIGSWIYNLSLKRYPGPDMFIDFTNKEYKQAFLGNTSDNLILLENKMKSEGINTHFFLFQALPFCSVNEFDYEGIAENINSKDIDIVWVSLGAPKQEEFMFRLLGYLKSGVLIAVGAAFNFYIGEGSYHRAPLWMQKINIEWIYRFMVEPSKQFKRIVSTMKIYPFLVMKELYHAHRFRKLNNQ